MENFSIKSYKSDFIFVFYFGILLFIPKTIKYLATSNNGKLRGFFLKPEFNEKTKSWESHVPEDCSISLGRIKYLGDPRMSLKKI